MNNSELHSNNNDERASKPSVFARYKEGIFLLAIVALSLIITFYLTNGFQSRQGVETEEAFSTVIASAPSATPASSAPSTTAVPPISPTPPVSPILPVSPLPASPESTTLDPETLQSMAERGIQLYESGHYEEALEIIDAVVDAEPGNPITYDLRGTIYTALGDYQNALDDYSKAIELDPSHAQVYYNRGRLYSILKRYDDALSDLERSVELDPNNFGYRAKGNIGLIYHRLGEYDKAIDAFEASISYNDEKADVFYLRGETFAALRDYEAAIADYEAAIERFSDYDLAYQSLGYAYYKMAEYDKAVEALGRALEISPDSPIAHFYFTLLYLATDDLDRARTELSQAVGSFSTLPAEEQEFTYDRVVAELQAFARENPDKASEVEAMIELIPEPQ